MSTTLTSGEPVPADGSHREIETATGMQKGYVVLSAEERAKGFVKPVRDTYVHVWRTVCAKMQPSDDKRIGGPRQVCSRKHNHTGACGNWWNLAQSFHHKLETSHRVECGAATTMGRSLAETYARDPSFYSGTFCVACKEHFPLEQFAWDEEGGEPMEPSLQAEWHARETERIARQAEKRKQARIAELKRELAELENLG